MKKVLSKRILLALILAAVVMAVGLFVYSWWKSRATGGSRTDAGVYVVGYGDLTISVPTSGNIEALNSVDIKSKVKGRTTIISIVDEGIDVTAEDVNNGKILVELDSSQIEQKLTQQEIDFFNAEARFTEAKENLDIQKKQNDSDIQKGLMSVRFGLMDFQKYLGDVVSEKLVSAEMNPGEEIALLINSPELGGEALQRLRELDGDIHLKEQELELAGSKLEWTEKLFEKEYVSLRDKEADRLDKERKEISRERTITAKDLFVKYEFPKQVEKLLSDYEEFKRELERTEARVRSKLAQAEANLKSREATYLLQKKRLEEQREQLEACTIRAPAVGQVVYGSSTGSRWQRQNRAIEVGAEIRERQKIISIPDPTEMKVKVKVHETWVDKVEVEQKVKIKIAAFPEEEFTGKVLKKAPMADPEHWLNPDLKVYSTDVCIDGEHDFLKTGMTAKAEIIVDELKDVLSVPIQAVVNREGAKICYVARGNNIEQREVETGLFNSDFVEIKSGLSEGERVLLNPPRISEMDAAGETDK